MISSENRYPLFRIMLQGTLARLLIELIIQMRLHGRPFGRDDAVDHSVAQRAVRRNLVVAQDAVQLGAEPFDAAPALLVEEMRAEFYRNAIELFERVRQQ